MKAAALRHTPRLALAAAALALLAGCATRPAEGPDEVPADAPYRESLADTVRLLEQSSFGPTPQTVDRVRRQGFARYLDEQFRLPASQMPVLPPVDGSADKQCGPASDATPAVRACRRENYSQVLVQTRFFQNALNEPDQLRQRVAFALGQIFVVSARKNNRAYAMARYQQMLLDNAFGTYRQLLEAVTLSPVMGQYLDMANNARLDPQRGIPPNENYAREVLQLFSIGLVRLNPDGSPQRGPDGKPLATYGPAEIAEFARAFTGWTYPPASGAGGSMTPPPPGAASSPFRRNPPYFIGRLVPAPGLHDSGPKTLLDGRRIPGSTDPAVDLAAALDTIAAHPNVGPFIGRRLIQHLTTSNPSPAYVERVARVFADNGRGVRGDLQAVVRAILLDPEARGDAPRDAQFGKLREPVLYVTGVLRSLGAKSDGVDLIGQSAGMDQNVFVAPTVFNFFPPDYELAGSMQRAPELAIVDSNTSLKRAEFAWRLIFGRPVPPDATLPGATGTSLSLAAWEPLADRPPALVDQLDGLLLHGSLPPAARQAVVQAVQAVPAKDAAQRVKTAAYLLVAGPQYQVQR